MAALKMGKIAVTGVLVAAVGAIVPVAAQVRMPTDSELEAIQGRIRFPTDAEIDAQRSGALSVRPSAPAVPPPAPTKPPVDIRALSKQVQQGQGRSFRPPALGSRPVLYVFVSMSVPAETLGLLAEQAARANATLVLRGLVDRSIRKTSEAVRVASGTVQSSWIVDPRLYERFDVSLVPTFVLADTGAIGEECKDRQCTGTGEFAKVAGDVSLDYALRQIASRQPSLGALANGYLARLAPGTR